MDEKLRVLNKYFGYSSFRGGQEELIDAQLGGRDVFGIMPTGGGKSLCYQIPGLILPGVCLVISPLISLMQDQVKSLCASGIPAAYINSSLSIEHLRLVYKNLLSGKYKIVYVAPERLLAEGFLAAVKQMKISLVAVDEAHCISQWGQDFRPSYLKIVDFLALLPTRPILSAFTATATPVVREDIARILKLNDPLRVVTGFDRPNLRFEIIRPRGKNTELITLLNLRRDKCGIVYCSTRKKVEDVCRLLQDRGFSATRYHAGLSDEERRENQEDFLFDRKKIMVATNAFGMGIDKSNVSYVIHYNMPQSLESYYQEAGRAGRDGEKAHCILLYGRQDIMTAKFLIQKSFEDSEQPEELRKQSYQQDMRRLNKMVDYCETEKCLRQYILSYFGERHGGKCGNCSSCLRRSGQRGGKPEEAPEKPELSGVIASKDITREAQMILSCVKRVSGALGHDASLTVSIRVLRGSKDRKLKEPGLDKLSTYGLMAAWTREELRELSSELRERGLIKLDSREMVSVTEKANGVLFQGERLVLSMDSAQLALRFPRSGSVDADSALLLELKELRSKIAAEEGVPAYVVFSNATLSDMAKRKPRTVEEFLKVSGVGQVKAERYARLFTGLIKNHKG